MAYSQLPPGLDPVQAGRFGLWLLGKRSHIKAQKRTYRATGVRGKGVAGRLMDLLLPWTVDEYPGHKRALAELCGVSQKTVPHWISGRVPLPLKHCETLLALLDRYRATADLLAEELRAEIADHAAKKPRGFLKRRGRSG